MKMKGTFVFTAVVGLLVAYAYIFEFKKADEEERQKAESAKFVKMKPEEIQSLVFETKEKFEIARNPSRFCRENPARSVDLGDTT